jgi:hypothetical protein
MTDQMDSIATGVPAALVELRRLSRILKQRATDVLAYFDRPHTSNGPTEAINGRLEQFRGSPSASATSPTTSPAASSKPAGSDPDYTVKCDEPNYRSRMPEFRGRPHPHIQPYRPGSPPISIADSIWPSVRNAWSIPP